MWTVRRGPHGLEMWVDAAENPEVDLWGARRRAKMFEKMFDTPLAIEWRANLAESNGAATAVAAGEPCATRLIYPPTIER